MTVAQRQPRGGKTGYLTEVVNPPLGIGLRIDFLIAQ